MFIKSVVKICRLTITVPLKLIDLSVPDVCGMRGVAVKCIDITQNSDSEGSIQKYN